jgi:hypothetical protein
MKTMKFYFINLKLTYNPFYGLLLNIFFLILRFMFLEDLKLI